MMANKIPLIVSRINGLGELLDDNMCIFVNPVLSIEGDISFDIKDLSNTILMLPGIKVSGVNSQPIFPSSY